MAAIFVAGCSSRRHLSGKEADAEWQAGSREDRDQYLHLLEAGQMDFQAVNARAKGFLTLNEQDNHEVTLQVRMQRDSAVWVSATALLGMEVGRLLIRPDSIKWINRLESTYEVHPYQKVEEWLGYNLEFGALQDLLTGNAGQEMNLHRLQFFSSDEEQGRFFIKDVAEIIFDKDYRLLLWQIRNFYGETLLVRHAYEARIPDHRFPSKTSISFQTPRLKLITTLDYNRQELPEQVDLPFSIPKGYRQIY